MLNFSVGPVQSPDCVKKIGALDVPYFRTKEFSEIMYENESLIKKFSYATPNSRVVFITGSGTASMEAVVMNCFTDKDLIMVVNGGSFGQRFVELCQIHNIPFIEVKPKKGYPVDLKLLEEYYRIGVTGLLINMHETSTGVLYPMSLVGDFCKGHDLFLAVDAISAFLADDLNMERIGADVMIAGSQKALACPPGISVIVLSEKALERIRSNNTKCMYLDLNRVLIDAERGQTPFTPAVSILLQINERLKSIDSDGGVEVQIMKTKALAEDFRGRIKDLPLKIVSHSLSNAVTPLHPMNMSAYDVFLRLKDEYGIWVCPNGGDLASKVFRVGHIGNLSVNDNIVLIQALYEILI